MAKNESLRGAVPLSHFYLRQRVRPGDRALDATCGNGFDTLLLAELAGEGGEVWAFDVQPRAIAATRALLEREGRLATVHLLEAGHERVSEFVPVGLAAAVFNLGYLPGGETSLVTDPARTVTALTQAAKLLKPGGVVTIALYTGHEGGPEEAQAVHEWGASLPPREYNVWCSRQLNRSPVAPYLVLVEKIRG
ncbi:rRNA methyltransferase, putative [Citrifermentans bemidjiense Bem]|uniref:rRNA methyltransferase, putative n=1 Tax=Citrifermentans bemidjiense (strain ATCC BAA-1014 / DSM 16622 / JCM 12645 / Bem) TaxID=404380 RepID=B5EAL4_CITBB|nr:class I SAM-dependent methyltransferase [Citrifermentans bemidjiense]ACH40353.1 rRNA methyltransferase, putative [Citrifermentans bemidjiense Bem]